MVCAAIQSAVLVVEPQSTMPPYRERVSATTIKFRYVLNPRRSHPSDSNV